ncbi:MAG: hypothetical protein ACI9TY_001582 [Alphaproteobacteria bacterium]|jgi:hypothetical protein
MNRTSASLIALMSLTLASQSAYAGISDMINGYFTFRQDQKPLIAPERTLPPKHIVSPNYHEKRAANWSNYYTRPDLQASEYLDNSSMVMRPDPTYRARQQQEYEMKMRQQNQYQGQIDPALGYSGIQRRANMNQLEKYQGNVYIGEAGTSPFNLDNNNIAGQKTQIGKPKRNWENASSSKVHPRIGDYDYVKSHKGRQASNAFGDYSGTLNDEVAQEVTRSSGYFTKDQVPLPSENGGYYQQDLPSNYIVQPRDSLSGISGQKQIYGDWKMWPLIYDKNRHQIQDPDLIHPGQDLGIPRASTQQDNNNARQRAIQKKAPYSFYDGK